MSKPFPWSSQKNESLYGRLQAFQEAYAKGNTDPAHNNLVRLLQNGAIGSAQLEQSLLSRGTSVASEQPDKKLRRFLSGSGVIYSTLEGLNDSEYLARKDFLSGLEPGAAAEGGPIRATGETEGRVTFLNGGIQVPYEGPADPLYNLVVPYNYEDMMRSQEEINELNWDGCRRLRTAADSYLSTVRGVTVSGGLVTCEEAEKLLLSHQTEFMVEHDWHTALCKAIPEVKDDEIELPFQRTTFEFTYLETPMRGVVVQDPQTHALTVESLYLSSGPADLFVVRPWYLANDREKEVFLEHVRYICVAMEVELAGKEQQVMPAFLKALAPAARRALKAPTITYKIRPLRQPKPNGEFSIPGVSGSKQRFHVRRSHWKVVKGVRRRIKWYFAGNIELGFIIKDYVLD